MTFMFTHVEQFLITSLITHDFLNFLFSGQEVRDVVLKYPKLLPWRREMIAVSRQKMLAYSKTI